MIIDIIDKEVFLKSIDNKELYALINDLNKNYIPYKSYCGTLIVLSYAVWLKANVEIK